MRIRTFAGVISALVLLSGCMTELSTPPTVPTAYILPSAAPADGLPALFAPTAPPADAPAAPAAPADAPAAPADAPADAPSFVPINCVNPAPEDVAVCAATGGN